MRDVNDLVATRTVIVQFPGKREYWLTDSAFSVGQTIQRDGRVWMVASVAGSAETGGKPRIRMTPADS